MFKDGTFENQKIVNITADSRHFEIEVAQSKHQDDVSLHSGASTGAGLSIISSVMEGFLNGLGPKIKSNLFSVILKDIKITRPEVRELVDGEMRGLKLIKSMKRAIQENRKPSTVRIIWNMFQPVR